MTNKHTPAPLELRAVTDYQDFNFGRIFSEAKDEVLQTDLICQMDKYARNQEMIDRKIELLNLFAAAPELLEALKILLKVDVDSDNGYYCANRAAAQEQARVAIAKAEGK